MLSALSKLVPRAFNKKSDKQRQTSGQDSSQDADDVSLTAKPFTCRVILLDDTELNLNVKVGVNIHRCRGYVLNTQRCAYNISVAFYTAFF